MTVLTDPYKTCNYSDGEGATFGDQNDSQRFLSARLNDQVLEKLIGSPSNLDSEFGSQKGANSATTWAYCLNIGGGNPKQGSANNKIKVGAGTLLQKVGTISGDEASLLSFTFDGTNEFTLSNGDASNPRVDMLQMKLEYVNDDLQSRDFQDATTHVLSTTSMNKKRQVQCTLSIKAGTPGASPVYPTPDSGYVPLACVVVGATYSGAAAFKYIDTAGAVAVLHDLRMPVAIKPYVVNPTGFIASTLGFTDADSLTLGANNFLDLVGSHIRLEDRITFNASANIITIPIAIRAGNYISAYSIGLDKSTSNASTVQAEIWSTTTGGVSAAVAATLGTHSGNSDHFGTAFGVSGLGIPIATNKTYWLRITPSGSVAPNPDILYSVTINYNRPLNWSFNQTMTVVTATAGSPNDPMLIQCPVKRCRLIACALGQASGVNTANTTKLVQYSMPSTTTVQMADLSGQINTTGTIKYTQIPLATIEASPTFTAGPAIQGNGTHNPPIWGNGKRCYEEGTNLLNPQTNNDTLAISFSSTTSNLKVYSGTFYVAEGL